MIAIMAKQKFTDIDMIAALNLHQGNITRAAKELGVTRAAVHNRIDTLPQGVLTRDLSEFRRNRADTFADIQKIILQYITPEKLKQASLQQLGTLFGIMYDKERLEQNLSTENIAHKHAQNLSDADRDALKKLVKDMTINKRDAIKYDD
jgi:hypothetical protein